MALGESDLGDDKRLVESACPGLDGPAYSFLDAVVFSSKPWIPAYPITRQDHDRSESPVPPKKKQRTGVERFLDIAAGSDGESQDGSGDDDDSMSAFFNNDEDVNSEGSFDNSDVNTGLILKSTEGSLESEGDEDSDNEHDNVSSSGLVRGEKGAVGLPCQRCIRALKTESTSACVFVSNYEPCQRICKKDSRLACLPQVSMQEAAQVVAWVRQYPSDERQ
ncbi:uncharacterized protein TRUGW13939_11671 [Talaromyces rugulosus]|uniref:Uncharacterized protein n=1 Tax=Talaromyces rugulosus TaxID=121627 RepID=A0A7H8RE16_TALRU|nr:uncharacterized protein TRUGW13939_11671 [Talaromyces rugulosus]QKX64496.1 hypothetical protein TRUGW13939_11671 [Talaromyces rugulosus]